MTTQVVGEQTLETLVGPLAQTFPLLARDTIQHSDELTTERRANPELRNQWFYTADSALYTIEDGEAFLYLGRGETNPIFNNIAEATQQLIQTRNYIPPQEDVDAVKSAESTLKVKLSDLELQGNDSKSRFFEIDTANYDSLNEHQRTVAERVYGSGEDFEQNMKMLRQNRINTTRVYVLNPDYVKHDAPQDGALALASRLSHFDVDSWFFADIGLLDLHSGLHGVRNVAEGDAPKVDVDSVANAYDTLLNNPERALEIMTPERVAGLSGLLTTYRNTQQ